MTTTLRRLLFVSVTAMLACALPAQNLLLNPSFEFHSFVNHRNGLARSYTSGSVAFWNEDAYEDIAVTREAHVDVAKRPAQSVGNIVSIKPGKKLWQVIALPEAGLAHGEHLDLRVAGWQSAPGSALLAFELLKIDSEDGTWSPKDFKMWDSRSFPKHARGELVLARRHEAKSGADNTFSLALKDMLLEGKFKAGADSHSADMNTVAVRVVLQNISKEAEVLFWAPALTRAGQGGAGLLPSLRPMEPVYCHLPKTMQKLWKGESLHILLMGSSIDRGSANPPMYLYDEEPASKTWKQPLSERTFEAAKVGRSELDGYFGWWQHYFSYAGRLRLELMRKFNLPISKLCLNFMACDGSCIAEATSGLADYCELRIPPGEGTNGHKSGTDWRKLYPELFTRPQGPGPDLVIFGSGANEKTDTPDEGAIFEATIRWLQQRYPDVEFVFCVFQNRGGYTPNPGDLQAIALRYQIPFMDYGKLGDELVRWCNAAALVPRDGHPQAAGHFFWYHTLARAFECWDPVATGEAQLRLPSRIYRSTIGWEGEITTYTAPSPRIRRNMFVMDDTAFNCWGKSQSASMKVFIDGKVGIGGTRHNLPGRDVRNSMYRWGLGSIGDRHVVELIGENAEFTAVDMKTINGRRFFSVSSSAWKCPAKPEPFASEWGAPCGNTLAVLKPGESAAITLPATDLSVAYLDRKEAGTLAVSVDGAPAFSVSTAVPFKAQDGKDYYLENRKGIRCLPYGMHTVTVTAKDGPVALLGIFSYDNRPNRDAERRVDGIGGPGERVAFVPPFKAVPIVHLSGGLTLKSVSREAAVFAGAPGTFTAIGE